MTENFLKAYNEIMTIEGLYSNNPADRGGETWKGVARNFYPKWEGWKIIDSKKQGLNTQELNKVLSKDEALEELVKTFYFNNYFLAIKLDKLSELEIVIELFDIAVNMGPRTAIDFLQRSLNLLNNNQKLYKDLRVDGDFGPTTYGIYKIYMASRNTKNNIKILLKALNGFQFNRYVKICEMNPTQEIFFYGWLNRV